MVDIKAKVQEMVEKLTKDKTLMSQFEKDPAKAVEKVVGVDLPDDVVNNVIDGVKAKLAAGKLADAAGSLKKLF